jgi:hypothetical protein
MTRSVPSVTYAQTGRDQQPNELGMRPHAGIMADDLYAANDRNDETLERIYIDRRFKNDTERLEKRFDIYSQVTTKVQA